jgi:hypothetical protein
MGALMRQDDPILVGLEPQRSDQVPPAIAVENNLMDVHRRRVGRENAFAQPFIEGLGGAVVFAARARQPDRVVWRKRLIACDIGFGDDVVRGSDQRARVTGTRKVVPDPW